MEIAKKVKGKDIAVTEEDVQDALNYLQKTRAKFIAENRPAAKKDFVEIEYSTKDINEGKPINDKFVLGEGGFLKGFEENIEGLKAGEEKEFKATFPENSARKDLAGKEVDFKVKVKSVQRVELPEINDELAKELGKFDTLGALKESMKKGITEEKIEAERQRKRGEILEKILEKVKVDLPDTLINYEQERLMEDLKQRISQGIKITFEQYLASIKQTEEGLKETFEKEAEKRIKGFLVLKEVGKKENIEVKDEEIEEEFEKAMKNYSKEQLNKIDSTQLKEYTKGVIYNEKVFEKLENSSL
jgi:trigger factor